MPNTDNINSLITLLESLRGPTSKRFEMGTWLEESECGTTACLGGWAETLMRDPQDRNPPTVRDIQEWLGITHQQGQSLFFPMGLYSCIATHLDESQRITAGIRVLTTLRDQNRVDWSEAVDFAEKEKAQ